MTDLYRAHGKQVLRQGEHFADACDATGAQIIADALNSRTPEPSGAVVEHAFLVTDAVGHMLIWQQVDGSYHCSCGRTWDRDEGDECPGAS